MPPYTRASCVCVHSIDNPFVHHSTYSPRVHIIVRKDDLRTFQVTQIVS